jgi:hypothetical protein
MEETKKTLIVVPSQQRGRRQHDQIEKDGDDEWGFVFHSRCSQIVQLNMRLMIP